jgi:hypothetical protein
MPSYDPADDRVEFGAKPNTGTPSTKLSRVRDALARGDERTALRIAAAFPELGDAREPIQRGWMAVSRPEFVRELGRVPAADVAAGVDAIRTRYAI